MRASLSASLTLIAEHQKERKARRGLHGVIRGRKAAALDALGAALLHQPAGAAQGLLRRSVSEERQVGDHQRAGRAADVFNAATIWWSDGLSAPPGYKRPSAHGASPKGPDPRVQKITANLLNRFRGG